MYLVFFTQAWLQILRVIRLQMVKVVDSEDNKRATSGERYMKELFVGWPSGLSDIMVPDKALPRVCFQLEKQWDHITGLESRPWQLNDLLNSFIHEWWGSLVYRHKCMHGVKEISSIDTRHYSLAICSSNPTVRKKMFVFFLSLPSFMHSIVPCWDQTAILLCAPLSSSFVPNILDSPLGLKEAHYLTVLPQCMQRSHTTMSA